MRAMQFNHYGDSDVLEYTEVAQPVPGPGQVLLRVAATSFNPVDAGVRGGYLQQVFVIDLPHIPGIDVAGTVAEIGDGVTGWKRGDAVVALLPMDADGAAAEYVLAPAQALTAAPHAVPLTDGAALPTVGLTAWQALFELAQLSAGQTVFINGAGGAVGGFAVQLAHAAGAVITATANPRSAARLRTRGADHTVAYLDYTATPSVLAGQSFDVVLNLLGTDPAQTDALMGVVADGGYYIGTMTTGTPDPARGVRAQRVFVRSDATQLAELVRRVDAGELHIDIAERRPLNEAAAVHRASDEGRLPGKTLLVPSLLVR